MFNLLSRQMLREESLLIESSGKVLGKMGRKILVGFLGSDQESIFTGFERRLW